MNPRIVQSFFSRIIVLSLCLLMVCSCAHVRKGRAKDIVAECCGKILTIGEIDQLTYGFTGEDSARMAEEYIRNWAIELLMYDNAHRATNRQIEELVADYRRSLYMHEYEQLLVAQRMPQMIEDSLVLAFYETHKSQLSLREMILKGALVVIPNGAPNVADLKRNLQHLDDPESLEWIEKYVYQYGVGYELFVEDWKMQEEVLGCIPLEKQELEKLLRKNRQVEVQDSINTYLLEVMDYHLAGSVMPLEYARKDIEKNILGGRRVDFLKAARNELYDKSLKNGKLVRYEK